MINTIEKEKKDEKYKELDKALNQIICRNLKALLNARGLSQGNFCKELAKEKVSISRSYLNKILNDPISAHISAVFLLSCCDFFGISLHNLVSNDFNPEEYVFNDTPVHKNYLNIEALIKEGEKQNATPSLMKPSKNEDSNYLLPISTSNLITDPDNILFTGYVQDYYCYYYPTHSSENKNSKNILKGILHLEKENTYCKAILSINTNTVDDNGNTNYKRYIGYAAISPTVNSMNCIMYSDSLCEFCFLMFRCFKLNFGKQDCRIAEVLSSSSADESRRPTVLRMLLSREKISNADLKTVSPACFLNYSTIAISESNLTALANLSKDYKEIVKKLKNTNTPQPMYFYKEQELINIVQQHLNSNEKALEFVMQLRALSYAYRYNKVSPKSDNIVRKILLSKGYYQKHSAQQTE